ncbi:MAG: FtsX-like permease family protein [Luteitalea sp.]|nr:FtsX-like permease family protein [Luteitalea sp.]
MSALARDIRQAFRLLSGHRGFAAAVLITIALGVGGTAAVFSVIYGVLLRPLPYPEADRLVRLWEVHPGGRAPVDLPLLSNLTYHTWSRSSATLQSIGAFDVSTYTVANAGATERLRGASVTPSLFRVLRVAPASGRFFNDEDAEKGAAPVVVLTHATWRVRFGDDSAIGKLLTIDGEDHRIIGIALPGFAFPGPEPQRPSEDRRAVAFYTPLEVPRGPANTFDIVEAIGRLRAGVTTTQVEVEGTSLARSLERPLAADLLFGRGGPVEVHVRSMVDQMTTGIRPALVVLAGGVGLVLLIACANVANLFLSRSTDRARELAVRAALGAERWRLVRQLLTESLVISLIGGGLGMFVGWAMTALVPVLAPSDFPRLEDIRVDQKFLVVAALAAICVGVIAGAMPAFRSSRIDLVGAIQSGGSRSVSAPDTRARRALLVVEAALAVVLLVGATLLARSFVKIVQVDAGYDPANVLTADLIVTSPPDRKEEAAERNSRLAVSVLDRLRAIPGVRAAGAGSMAPFGNMIHSTGFHLPGMTTPDGRPLLAQAYHAVITPGYAEALGMRLEEGRFFREADTTSATRSMLVNETFAKTYFADGKPPTGRRFTGLLDDDGTIVEVVGVVADVLPADLDAEPQSRIYTAHGTRMKMGNATFVVKTEGDPTTVVPLLRGIVQQLEPSASLNQMGPLASKISASVAEPRFTTLVLGAFALLALALATTGLYGVLSYNVAQRRREIGVRAALGATRGDLVQMVLREGLTVTVIGLAVGAAVAAFATRAMASVLFGVAPLDAIAFSVAPILLVVVAYVACLIPAWRAAGIDPAEALRRSRKLAPSAVPFRRGHAGRQCGRL